MAYGPNPGRDVMREREMKKSKAFGPNVQRRLKAKRLEWTGRAKGKLIRTVFVDGDAETVGSTE